LPDTLRLPRTLVAALALLVSACSSSSSGDAGLPYAGDCVLTAAAVRGELTTYSASAEFGAPVAAKAFCANGMLSGNCCLYTGGGPDAGAVGGPGISAGTLTATDGLTPVTTLDYDISTSTYPLKTNANPWGGGDTLSWTGDGLIAGAFQGSVTAPSLLLGLNPDPGATPSVPVQRSTDLTVSWTPDALATSATMELDLEQGLPVEFGTLIVCKVADSAGTLVVPASLLSMVPNGSGYILYQRRNQAATWGHNVSVNLVGASTSYGAATFQ